MQMAELLEDNNSNNIAEATVLEVSTDKNSDDHHARSSPIAKLLWGVLIILGIAISWVGATQFAKEAYSPEFDGPFFFIWFATCWMVVCFPTSLFASLISTLIHRQRGKNVPTGDLILNGAARNIDDQQHQIISTSTIRTSFQIYGPRGLTAFTFCTRVLLFCCIWLLTNYLYLKALSYLHPSDVTALFVSNTAFVYMLSMVFLGEKFNIIRLASVAFSITGVVLFVYLQSENGLQLSNFIGILFVVIAAFAAGLYQVLFKRIIGNSSNFNQVALFLTMIGICNAVLMWPIMLIFRYSGVEKYEWNNLPWTFLTGSAALQLVFNFLINFGVAFTFPLFIAVGTLLGIPLNAIVDVAWRQVPFTAVAVVAMVMICIGFCLMLTPEAWNQCLMRLLCPCCVKKEDAEYVAAGTSDPAAADNNGQSKPSVTPTVEDDTEMGGGQPP